MLLRILLGSGTALILGVFAWFQLGGDDPEPSLAQAVSNSSHSQSSSIYATGRIEGSTEEIALRPRVTGTVMYLLVADGDDVEEGQELLRLNDEIAQAKLKLAQAELQTAEHSLKRLINGARTEERAEAAALLQVALAEQEQLQLSYRRAQPLHRDGVLAEQEFDDLRMRYTAKIAEVEAAKSRKRLVEAPAREDDVAIAKAKVSEAQAKLEIAERELEQTILRAPSAGKILDANVRLGEQTGPNSKRAPILFCNIDQFHARAYVDELDATKVKKGMSAKVKLEGSQESISGTVVKLAARMDKKRMFTDDPSERVDTRTREIWIELDPQDALIVGHRVDVYLSDEPHLSSDATVARR